MFVADTFKGFHISVFDAKGTLVRTIDRTADVEAVPDRARLHQFSVSDGTIYAPVEIYTPISQIGTLPYSIGIELPMPMSGRAEYLPSTFGKPSWHVDPKNKQREKELNHLLPKNQMWKNNYGMGIQYRIKVGQTLEPTPEGKTHWLINSGLESGRPEIKKFLEGISTVKHLLTTWIVAEPRII